MTSCLMLMFSSMTIGLSGAVTEIQPDSIDAVTSISAAAPHARWHDRLAPCSIRCMQKVFAAGCNVVNPKALMAGFHFPGAECRLRRSASLAPLEAPALLAAPSRRAARACADRAHRLDRRA